MLKSGRITSKQMVAVCVRAPPAFLPVTTTLYLPAAVAAGTAMLIVVVAD